jgi:hypothetical protein
MTTFGVIPLRDRQAAARHGRFIPVRTIGAIADMDGELLTIGIDHDTVTIGDRCFTLARVEEVAQVLVSAVWAAGANAQAMAQEARDG